MSGLRCAGAWLLAATTVTADARADPFAHAEDDARGQRAPAESSDPLRGSTFIFDQSVSTQTIRLDPSVPLSYVPYYGWWLSLRPRWNFNDHLRVQARFDYYKEFTNSEDTTYYRQNVFGDIGTDLVYSRRLADYGVGKNSKWSLGLRALWPTSAASQGSGIYVTLGGLAALSQKIPLRGDDAPAFNSARLGLSFVYLHPFTHAITATDYGNFQMVSQTDSGASSLSDQLTGYPLTKDALFSIADASLQILPRLGVAATAIWIDQWHYIPPPSSVATLTGPASVSRVNDEQFTQFFWFVASVDYELMDEVSLGAGYYDLANVVGMNGQLRSPFLGGEDNAFWSPNACLFVDVTANLDKIWERSMSGAKDRARVGDSIEAARSAREARLVGQSVR
ncbi:MAG: hypothetical protein ABSF69_16535 [Polyangiaceae bacterium]